jgi:hypothetical protein
MGAGYGDWHIPDVGMLVLCIFPGVTQDGVAGDDLDSGYAMAYVSTSEEPPVDGLVDALSVDRNVYKGKVAVAHDVHLQGDLDQQIDGDETTLLKGSEERVVEGSVDVEVQGREDRSTGGIFAQVWQSIASLIGDLAVQLRSKTILSLVGDQEIQLDSALIDINGGVVTVDATGAITVTGGAAITINGTTLVDLVSAQVKASNGGAVQSLCNETFLATFNAHKHVGGNAVQAGDVAVVGDDTTLILKGE